MTVVGGTDDTAAFTSRIEAQPLAGGGSTSISAGLVAQVRDALVSRGITINGLPISSPEHREPSLPEEPTLAWYYESCVIGGPNSFVVAVSDPAGFEKALRLKLMREIAGLSPRIQTAVYRDRVSPNCFAIDQSAGR